MKKRLLILVLLFANIVFFSCSPERSSSVVNQSDIHMPGTNDANLEEGLTYDDIKKKHYDRQSERTKKMMRESDKQSKKQFSHNKKKTFSLFGRKNSCTNDINDEVVKDGVRDIR